MSGYNLGELLQEAQFHWLRPAEVLFILQNYEKFYLYHEPPQKPPSGSLSLFNRRVVRFFRKDGHSWRKKKDGKTVSEAYERLKVGNVDVLNCYYAHGEENPNFQRRSYWMLEPAMDRIVLVHYRDITVTKSGTHSIYIPPPSMSDTDMGQGGSYIHDGNLSHEVGGVSGHQAPSISDMVRDNMSSEGTHSYSRDQSAPSWNALNNRDSSTMMIDDELQIDEALRMIQKQLSLEPMNDNGTFYDQNAYSGDIGITYNEQNYSGFEEFQYGSDNSVSLQYPGYDGSLENYMYPSYTYEVHLTQQQSDLLEGQAESHGVVESQVQTTNDLSVHDLSQSQSQLYSSGVQTVSDSSQHTAPRRTRQQTALEKMMISP